MRILIDIANEGRLSRDDMYMSMAYTMALRSECARRQVGAIITMNNRIVSTGYNGSLKRDGACVDVCDINSKCLHAIHAEANAMYFAASQGIKLFGATLYCTMSPCMECAKGIIQTGIMRVVYAEEYRLADGLLLLSENDIEITRNKNVHLATKNN